MMQKPIDSGLPWHPLGCQCETCNHPIPSEPHPGVIQTASIVALAGFAAGLALVTIIDWLTGGPGIGVMFQW